MATTHSVKQRCAEVDAASAAAPGTSDRPRAAACASANMIQYMSASSALRCCLSVLLPDCRRLLVEAFVAGSEVVVATEVSPAFVPTATALPPPLASAPLLSAFDAGLSLDDENSWGLRRRCGTAAAAALGDGVAVGTLSSPFKLLLLLLLPPVSLMPAALSPVSSMMVEATGHQMVMTSHIRPCKYAGSVGTQNHVGVIHGHRQQCSKRDDSLSRKG